MRRIPGALGLARSLLCRRAMSEMALFPGFSFLDHVELLERGRAAEGTWSLDAGMPLLRAHFPLRPMLPGSILIESFAQLGSLLLEASLGFAKKALPVWIEGVRFRRAVEGATPVRVRVRVELVRARPGAAELDASAHQHGARCAHGRLGFALAPMSEYFGPEHLRAFRKWLEPRLDTARLVNFPQPPLEALREYGG